jgi:hypothetical protein
MAKVECQQHKDRGIMVAMDEEEALTHYLQSYKPISAISGQHECFSFEQVSDRDIVWVYTSDAEDGVKRIHWQKYKLTEVVKEGFIPPKA